MSAGRLWDATTYLRASAGRTPSAERLEAGLRSSDAFTLRRCQILLASARGERAPAIAAASAAATRRCATCIARLRRAGARPPDAALLAARARSPAPSTPAAAERLRALLHQSPAHLRPADQPLDAGAGRRGRLRAGADRRPASAARRSAPRWPGWGSAGGGPSAGSPAPTRSTPGKKAPRPPDPPGPDATPTGPWASRTRSGGAGWPTRPCTPGPTPDRPLRLVEQTVAKDDPDPKALACYGLLVRWWPTAPTARARGGWLRFVDGRPVSAVTTDFLAWCCEQAGGAGQDGRCCWSGTTPPGTSARRCARWIGDHNRQVKGHGPGRAPRRLPPADQEPLAQPHRAQVGPRQAPGRRAGPPAHRPRTGRAGLRRLPVPL